MAIEGYAEQLLDWLGSISMQAAVLIGLALALSFALRSAAPRLRHFIWLVVLLRLAIPVEVSSPLGLLSEPTGESSATRALQAQERLALHEPRVPQKTETDVSSSSSTWSVSQPGSARSPVSGWLAAGWLAGVAALLALVALRTLRAKRLLGNASLADESIQTEVSDLSRRLGIEPPQVKVANSGTRLPSPAAFGLWRPIILLPEALASQWTAPEREPLLVHELSHLRRRDLWINSLQLFVQTLYFFHPLVWFANRRLRVARELACDEEVVRFYGAASNRYARALLRAARTENNRHTSALAVTLSTPRSLLGRRVERLLTRRGPSPRRQWGALTVAVAGSLVMVALAGARPARIVAEVEVPTDRKEWLTFVRELDDDSDRSQAVEAVLIERVRSGEGDPELLERTLAIIRPPRPPWMGDSELESAWLQRLELLPTDLPSLRAAASFFTLGEPDQAEELLRRGREMQPGSAYWPVELARLEYLRRKRLADNEQAEASRRALELLEEARPVMTEAQLYPRLGFFARAAYGAGEMARAGEYATLLLDAADGQEDGWNYGNALHQGHTTLGLVALARGDRAEALRRLRLSAETPGSPQLNSFGPSFKLASELLALGERDAVLGYLDRCGEFWAGSRGKLESYVAAISAGETPDFRELHY